MTQEKDISGVLHMQCILSKEDLLALSSLDIDEIHPITYNTDAKLVHGNSVGYWTREEKVVLEPIYHEIQRFDNGDILKVGVKHRTDSGIFILYGAYSISKQRFVIETKYSNSDFWKQFDMLRTR